MSKGTPCYYWDTSIFLLLLTGDKKFGEDTLSAARDIFLAVEQKEAKIIASEIVVAEILPANNTREAYEKWEACLQWENLVLRSVDHPVAVRAAKLRSDCLKKKPQVKIKLPDALHVATFLIYSGEIDELHSVDPDFQQALTHGGEVRTATKPRKVQTTMEDELFAENGSAADSVEEPDALDADADETLDNGTTPKGPG